MAFAVKELMLVQEKNIWNNFEKNHHFKIILKKTFCEMLVMLMKISPS